ncbi:MAG: carboxypeptidase M32 [Candidatus Rhabdochlamydia sp.]
MTMKKPYHKLKDLAQTSATWQSISDLLSWDQDVCMPPQGSVLRSAQHRLIGIKLHQSKVSSRFKKLLAQLIDMETGVILDTSLSLREQAAVKLWRKDYLSHLKLPASFVGQMTQLTSTAVSVWKEAREHNSFSSFAPYLEKIVRLSQQKCRYLSYLDHPYDALLDTYEPGCTVAKLNPLFAQLKQQLTGLLKKIQAAPSLNPSFLKTPCDLTLQFEWGKKLLEMMGFDPLASRLDLADHPSCSTFCASDIRMTTRIASSDFMSNISSILHEAGHGLYGRGLPAADYGTPLAETASMGLDESQSRLLETRIGRCYEFWHYALPSLQETFPQLKQTSLFSFYQGINQVTPSFIRVEADEVTYCLHIILRFEMEKDLIAGVVKVKDIPDVWKQKMQELLGICPPDDASGALQDIHWALGYFGYFPSYALGNLYASQLFETFTSCHLDWKERICQGDFSSLHSWLHQHLYMHGRQFSPEEFMMNITGKPLSTDPFTDYLLKKYTTIYGLSP